MSAARRRPARSRIESCGRASASSRRNSPASNPSSASATARARSRRTLADSARACGACRAAPPARSLDVDLDERDRCRTEPRDVGIDARHRHVLDHRRVSRALRCGRDPVIGVMRGVVPELDGSLARADRAAMCDDAVGQARPLDHVLQPAEVALLGLERVHAMAVIDRSREHGRCIADVRADIDHLAAAEQLGRSPRASRTDLRRAACTRSSSAERRPRPAASRANHAGSRSGRRRVPRAGWRRVVPSSADSVGSSSECVHQSPVTCQALVS